MSLDDERTNWKHYEQLERGVLPEVEAASEIGSLIGKHVPYDPAVVQSLAGKVVASRHPIRQILDRVDADPRRLREPRVELRQDPVADLSALDFFLEQQAYHERGAAEAAAMVAAIRARSHVDGYSPDAREVDREDDRLREQRQDAAAQENAPRFAS